jgi:hypothetical protein
VKELLMKKMLSTLVFLTMLVALSACANDRDKDQLNESKASPDASVVYAPVLISWKKAIQENFGYSKETQAVKTYPFIGQSLPNELSQAHYAYYDLDGNGTSELLIAAFYDSGYYHLADVFTIHNGKPVRLFEGVEDRGFWSRNRLDFSEDGRALIISGSGGAAYTNTDFYKVSESGYQVELLEGLTTYNQNDLNDLTPYYHLRDGTYEIATDIDQVMEKYYDSRYLDESESLDYFSDFYKQINWQPVVQTPDET